MMVKGLYLLWIIKDVTRDDLAIEAGWRCQQSAEILPVDPDVEGREREEMDVQVRKIGGAVSLFGVMVGQKAHVRPGPAPNVVDDEDSGFLVGASYVRRIVCELGFFAHRRSIPAKAFYAAVGHRGRIAAVRIRCAIQTKMAI